MTALPFEAQPNPNELSAETQPIGGNSNENARSNLSGSSPRRIVGRGGSLDGQGPHIHLLAELVDGRVVNPTFKSYSCPAAFASAQALCDLVDNNLLTALPVMTEKDIVACIGHDLPRSQRHCIHLALEALANFIRQAHERD